MATGVIAAPPSVDVVFASWVHLKTLQRPTKIEQVNSSQRVNLKKKSWNKSYKEFTYVLILDIVHGHIDPFHLLNLRSFNSLHQSDRTAVLNWRFYFSCAVVPSCGIKSKVYSQSFLAAVCGQHNSFLRQCGYQWSGKNLARMWAYRVLQKKTANQLEPYSSEDS